MIHFCALRVAYAAVLAKLYDHPDLQVFIMAAASALTMAYLAVMRPYRYPYRNFIAILNEAGAFYIFCTAMIWARSEIFSQNQPRNYVAPMVYTFVGFLAL